MIKLSYSTIDRFYETRSFKTLKGAKAYFDRRIGTTYDIGFNYAVDMFGTGKLRILEGTTWAELLDYNPYDAIQGGPEDISMIDS